jgi:hypothetical protein
MPALPKTNKDAFKHLSRCIGAYCVDNITGSPMLPGNLEQILKDQDDQHLKKCELISLLVSGLIMLLLIAVKMEDALD